MKKIIFAALAVLMMLGFAGCSGDLHDYVDLPPSGYWFYVDVPSDTPNLIFNDANGQSNDLSIDVSSGSVYYTYNGGNDGNKQPTTVFSGDNKPESKAGRVWIVSTLETFNAYYWGGESDATWPGVAVKKSEFVLEN